MKYAWKKVSSITTSQRHLGSHRIEPTENLHPGDVYQNKVTGCTYEWSVIEESESPRQIPRDEILQPLISVVDKPHFEFSRRPDSGKNDWHERGELPPVGTDCEAKFDKEWFTVEILKYNENKIAACHILNSYIDGGNLKWSCEFRPLKSERERAIEEIAIATGLRARDGRDVVAAAIYDAGYRKEGK